MTAEIAAKTAQIVTNLMVEMGVHDKDFQGVKYYYDTDRNMVITPEYEAFSREWAARFSAACDEALAPYGFTHEQWEREFLLHCLN